MEKTVKNLVEEISDKLGRNITEEEEDFLDSLDRKLERLEHFEKEETLYYGNENLDHFKNALERVEKNTRTKNTSIDIVEHQNGFQLNVRPTRLSFLADLFVFYGMNMEK